MTDEPRFPERRPPTPKYETPQDNLPPRDTTVTDSPESPHLPKRYVPGSAAGTAAPPTQPLRFTRGR